MNAVLQVLGAHVSVRDYAPDPIPNGDWEAILSAGQRASTDATGQLYAAVEIREPALRQRLAAWAGDQSHVTQAARVLVVCLDVRRMRLLLEHRGERYGMRPLVALLFGITDAALFAQNACVAAESLGYGVCYLGAVQNHPRAIARALELPPGVAPLWGVTFGRPARRLAPKPRVPLNLVHHVDRYRDPAPADLDAAFDRMKAATRSGDWLNPIRKYFAEGGIMEGREEEFRALLREQGFDPGLAPPDS